MPVLERNSTLTLQKIASSCTFTNFALAVGLYNAKKHIYVIYAMWRKFRNFAIQAISSENDQKIGRKYNGNIAGDFLRKTPL